MVCDGIRGDGFDLYHRLSPLILVTVSLVLPSEQKELLVILIRLILGLEDEQTQQGTQPWGRYIVKATREVLLEFRLVILEGRYCDSEVPLQLLRTTLCNVALLRDGRSPPGYLLVWEPGSVASQHLISSCFFPADTMLKVIAHRARCKFWANRDAPSSFNVFCDVFVAWDNLHSSWWTRALHSPFTWMPETQEDERRCCHANMLCTETTPTFPVAPTAKAIRAAVVNPYVRCEPKGTGKWVAAHISSLWVPGLKPFDDVHDEDVVTKFMFPGEHLSSSRLMIDRPMDFERFSGVLGKMRDGTYLGEVVSQVAMDAVFPYTPYSYLPGFHVKGYFVLPVELSPQRGRISFYTALDVGTEAVFLKTHNDHWSRLVIVDNCVSARFRARHPALVIVISRRRGTVGGEFSPSLLGILEYITVED